LCVGIQRVNHVKITSTISDIFYGWKIVAALFVMLSFSSGLGFYAHTIYLQALAQQVGYSITVVSGAVSLFFLASGIAGLAIAPMLEKHDVRVVIVPGALLAALCLWLFGSVRTTTELFTVYVLFGIGFAASGLLPATTLIARWFEVNRAKALSVASTGLSLGGITLTPLCAVLIDTHGLSVSAPWLAVVYVCGIVPVALLLRSYPTDLGLTPDGSPQVKEVRVEKSIAFRDAVQHPFFWMLGTTYLFVMLAQVGAIAHQYGLLSERTGIEESRYVIAILPLFSIIGRLAGGWILDKVSTRKFTLCMIVLQCLSLALVGIADELWLLGFALALFGITVGNLLMLQPLIIAETFGLKDYARIYSWSNLLTMIGVAGGPALMGFLFVTSGSYQLPYLAAAGMGIVAYCIFSLSRTPEIALGASADFQKY
jgi:MFS family permease